ncbi:4Fe-4S dicluster domain-containing protein [Garciella nitratireducens]|uniref:[FeFe] hydrogenase, group B1/B3 n=1 Tax=Garciella nitratireducens DSM 15102 TaxID=1121911 RepID=A0A1T4KYX9_9FIRM|nr:4Fe-4S dicluster domain-containing protein [Garciella nitratireducens]SJZ47530.1 [FeFe] hydrogenase, group B1/B3 [Garciella nitratireducens DSM 15102]
MKESYVDIIKIRRMVFAEVARLAYEDVDLNHLEDSTYYLLPGERAIYRENIFRERAVIGERLRMALGMDVRSAGDMGPMHEGFDKIDINERVYEPPLVNVISFACEACPTKTVKVTNTCRKCLAHPCENQCPVNAITIEKTAAVIDQEKCIKCGKCIEACPYSAIIKYDRPCASVCGVNAIGSDELGRAKIDHDKCVSCGRCISECPFGAIADKSQIYQLIKAIKSGKEIYAIIAPSFVGQFGALTKPDQVIEGIKKLGIKDVVEVSLGADITTINEAKEYLEKVPDERPFMGTSCCSAWSFMVRKLFPKEYQYISDSSSPMIYTAQYVKQDHPNAQVVFIGPCISKKLEALEEKVAGYVDFVITFEELMGMFIAKDIEISDLEVDKNIQDASTSGRGYAISGGVADAVTSVAKELEPDREIKTECAQGLHQCVKMMKLAKAGKKNGYLLEGMACNGGCIGGPGTLTSINRVRKDVTKFSEQSPYQTPFHNEKLNNLDK